MNKSVIMVCFFLGGCSVYQAAIQSGPADLSGIGLGTPRITMISKLGAPKTVDTDNKGHKQDFFEFQSGMHQATKARVLLYLAADVFSFALAEIALWPFETIMLKSATCTGIATYDSNLKVENWMITNKDDSSIKVENWMWKFTNENDSSLHCERLAANHNSKGT
jgi:hypothetical protein